MAGPADQRPAQLLGLDGGRVSQLIARLGQLVERCLRNLGQYDPLLKLVSVMDHSPGQRQFVNLDKYREYYLGKYKLSENQVQDLI